MQLVRLGLCAVLAASLAGCAVTEQNRQRAYSSLARNISDEAIAYNEGYSGAVAGQILLNILRAYHRQPRQYMAMSGFNNTSRGERQTTIGVAGLPLDRLGQEWGTGSFSSQNTAQDVPQFTATPFTADAFSDITRTPASAAIFRHYWEGWNRDMLLVLMVDRIEVASRGERASYSNHAGTIAANCDDPRYNGEGCSFVRMAGELVRLSYLHAPTPLPSSTGCLPIAVYNASAPAARPRPRRNPPPCPVTVVVGGTMYTFTLRSLDGMIYYLGELLRYDQFHPSDPNAFAETRLSVRSPGSNEPGPLFRIVEADRNSEREYAATVTYAGRRYSAGAQAARFCYNPRDEARCRDLAPQDRSGTVLEFLVGILAFTQSEASAMPPENTTVVR